MPWTVGTSLEPGVPGLHTGKSKEDNNLESQKAEV